MEKKTCDCCGGTGQISFFKGVSRFLLSIEECHECAGLGYVAIDLAAEQTEPAKRRKIKKDR